MNCPIQYESSRSGLSFTIRKLHDAEFTEKEFQYLRKKIPQIEYGYFGCKYEYLSLQKNKKNQEQLDNLIENQKPDFESKYEEENEELKDYIDILKMEKKKLAERFNDLKEEKNQLAERFYNLKSEFNELKEENEKMKLDMSYLKNDNKILLEHIHVLKNYNEKLAKSENDFFSENNDLRMQIRPYPKACVEDSRILGLLNEIRIQNECNDPSKYDMIDALDTEIISCILYNRNS